MVEKAPQSLHLSRYVLGKYQGKTLFLQEGILSAMKKQNKASMDIPGYGRDNSD